MFGINKTATTDKVSKYNTLLFFETLFTNIQVIKKEKKMNDGDDGEDVLERLSSTSR